MSSRQSHESAYQFMLDNIEEFGNQVLPCRPTVIWRTDPKLLLFVLSRHKAVARILSGYEDVLEVGCGDGFASRLLHPVVSSLTSIDIDPVFIDEARKYSSPDWPVSFHTHDITKGPFLTSKGTLFDAAYSLDVFEHITPNHSDLYAKNVTASLKDNSVFVVGCPSLESQTYASPGSKEGHVNCMNGVDMKAFFSKYFHHTFLFSMNDEVLHTGFTPMAHYNLLLCTTPIR